MFAILGYIGSRDLHLYLLICSASGITRDVSHIIREVLIQRANDQQDGKYTSSGSFPGQSSESFPQAPPSGLTSATPISHSAHRLSRQAESKSLSSVRILVNLVQNGNDKRLIPRLELQGDQNAGLPTLLKNVQHYQQQRQQSQAHQLPSNRRVRAWLKEGLVPIRNDEEWMAALMAAHTVDWMDGELRIVVDDEAS